MNEFMRPWIGGSSVLFIEKDLFPSLGFVTYLFSWAVNRAIWLGMHFGHDLVANLNCDLEVGLTFDLVVIRECYIIVDWAQFKINLIN